MIRIQGANQIKLSSEPKETGRDEEPPKKGNFKIFIDYRLDDNSLSFFVDIYNQAW